MTISASEIDRTRPQDGVLKTLYVCLLSAQVRIVAMHYGFSPNYYRASPTCPVKDRVQIARCFALATGWRTGLAGPSWLRWRSTCVIAIYATAMRIGTVRISAAL